MNRRCLLAFLGMVVTGLALAGARAALAGEAEAAPMLRQPVPADHVIVDKTRRELHLMRKGFIFHSFRIALGDNPEGHKQVQGDKRTPEGAYMLDWWHPSSSFYKAIRISYPNERDRARAAARGQNPGGAIMIHGLPNGFGAEYVGHPHDDWTDGCIAVTNREMDIIHRHVQAGTPITILP